MSRYSILYNNETRCSQDVDISNNHKPYSCFLNIDVTIFLMRIRATMIRGLILHCSQMLKMST